METHHNTTIGSTYDELVRQFPFEHIRPVQHRALEVIAQSRDHGKQFTIIEAPTGAGKSPLSIATGEFASQVSDGAYILTSQNTLLTQMMNDFGDRGLVELRGKSNYSCVLHAPLDCAAGADCNLDGKLCGGCPYREAKDRFLGSNLGITNYSYYLAETRHVKELQPREYLVADECHNIEQEILNLATIEISAKKQSELSITIPTFPEGARDEIVAWMESVLVPAIKGKLKEYDKSLGDARGRDINRIAGAKPNQREIEVLSGRIRSLKGLQHNIEEYMEDSEGWFAWTNPDGLLTIRPLSAADHAQRLLFAGQRNVLMMSATVLDPKTMMRSLGIPGSKTNFFHAPSDFPKENRRIVIWPTGSMSYKEIDNTLPRVCQRIEKLVEKYSESKGLIHTQTYRINQAVVEYLGATQHGWRVITHGSGPGSREDAIAAHMASEDPTILVSPSMTEGLDLKDDLSRFQVICKVPFPFIDPYTRERMTRDPDWYQLKTALTLVQATGRSVRSITDYAVTVILDSAINDFLIRNQSILPDWWKAAIEFK